jgi:hypothetical protein
MRRMRRVLRCAQVAVTLAVGLTLMAATAGAAQAAPADPGTPGGKLVRSAGSTTRRADAAIASCPSRGQRVKTSTSASVYLVGPDYELYLIPTSTDYFSLWDSWNGIQTNDSLWYCYQSNYVLAYAELIKTSDGKVWVYDYSYYKYRWITSPSVFNEYGFAWDKVQDVGYWYPSGGPNWDN